MVVLQLIIQKNKKKMAAQNTPGAWKEPENSELTPLSSAAVVVEASQNWGATWTFAEWSDEWEADGQNSECSRMVTAFVMNAFVSIVQRTHADVALMLKYHIPAGLRIWHIPYIPQRLAYALLLWMRTMCMRFGFAYSNAISLHLQTCDEHFPYCVNRETHSNCTTRVDFWLFYHPNHAIISEEEEIA